MTTTNMSNANTEVNYIRTREIAQRDGKAGALFMDINAAVENCASLEEITELEKQLAELKTTQPDYEFIYTMEDWLTVARQNAEDAADFESIKAKNVRNTGDIDIAEDLAWELVYSPKARLAKNNCN